MSTPDFTIPGYDYNFALRVDGFLALENVSQEEIFNAIEEFYVPEFMLFTVEYYVPGQGWLTVC